MDHKKRSPVLGALLLAAACRTATPVTTTTAEPQPSPSSAKAVKESAPPAEVPPAAAFLARLPDSEEGAGAAISGTLRVQDGCVVLDPRTGPMLLLGVTNPRIIWNEAAQQLEQGSDKFTQGMRVTVGGMQATPNIAETLRWRSPLPPTCATRPIWITSSVAAEAAPTKQAE